MAQRQSTCNLFLVVYFNILPHSLPCICMDTKASERIPMIITSATSLSLPLFLSQGSLFSRALRNYWQNHFGAVLRVAGVNSSRKWCSWLYVNNVYYDNYNIHETITANSSRLAIVVNTHSRSDNSFDTFSAVVVLYTTIFFFRFSFLQTDGEIPNGLHNANMYALFYSVRRNYAHHETFSEI